MQNDEKQTIITFQPFRTDFNFYYPYHGKKYLVEIKNGYPHIGNHWKEVKVYTDKSSTFNYALDILCQLAYEEEIADKLNKVGMINPASKEEIEGALKKMQNKKIKVKFNIPLDYVRVIFAMDIKKVF